MDDRKIILDENEMPKKWYNVNADLPRPPEEILKIWRPSPLYRAKGLEEALGTPAKIYYKWEGVSPPGSHKPNSAVPQAYYNMKEGIERLSTETGAGQWGSSLAFAANHFDLECLIYMVRVSYEQKPYRKMMMHTWGAEVVPSPSNLTESGKAILKKDPNCSGSLGIAISEAVEDAMTHDNTHYTLGSVLGHVCTHQSIIGLETQAQLAKVDDKADYVIGCVGGGSNFSGMAFPFVHDKLVGDNPDVEIIAAEPMACPTLTKGVYAYDYGDTAKMAPVVRMYTLGHDFVPAPIHAGGLRYHGDSPNLCLLVDEGVIGARAYYQRECFEAAIQFARTEGFIVAPEASHAVKCAIDLALECKKTGEEKTIVFNNSGHGHFDLSAYEAYFSGELVDYEYPTELIKQSLGNLPKVG